MADDMPNPRDTVIAPGGPRARSSVVEVRGGAAAPPEPRETRAKARLRAASGDTLVLTPGGFRSRGLVRELPQGFLVQQTAGSMRLLTASRALHAEMEDKVAPRGRTPAMGSGWITYASWLNGTGTPVSSFSTTWTVPRAPTTQSGQTIFLFNGIEPGDYSHILQPVLQWGSSAAGGGDYWSVASWYVGASAVHTPLVRVNEGDVLVGVMTLTGRSNAGFTYNAFFQGIAGTSLPVQNIPELTWCSQTLEAYGVTKCSDYPATDTTPMTGIDIVTGSSTPAVSWSVTNSVTDCGQRTLVIRDSGQDGEVLLGYRPEASWNHNDLSLAAGSPPLAASRPFGYTWSVDRTQHVVYAGGDGHVHELWFNGAWHHNDLTVAAGAPLTIGPPVGYTWDVDNTQHVVFRGGDGHVHELWFNGAWHHNDLTVAAGAPLAAGAEAGYTWAVDKTQHVVFRGVDGHIHELWFNGAWHHNDLTTAAGAPAAADDPAGYTWDVDSTEHVVFRGVDGHIHELWFNGAWRHNDLTAAAGGTPLAVGRPTGYTWASDKTQHVVYRGLDGRIHELWFNGAWNHNDLTEAAGGAPPAASDPAGYVWSADDTQHVVYRGVEGDIHELWFNGQWNYNDLTRAAAGAPPAQDAPAGYTWDVDTTEHVVYRGVEGRIHELWL